MKQKSSINSIAKYTRQRGIPLEEAKEHKVCKEYKKYCEEVFGCRISEKEGIR